MSELTPRALLVGCALGALLAAGNVVSGLKSGWGDTGTLTAALLGFAVLGRSARRAPYSTLENNLTQTVASSAAGMAFTCGTVGAMPALLLTGHHFPAWSFVLLGLSAGLAGTVLGVALRTQFLEVERLPFPSGIATAKLIEAMHRSSEEARPQAVGLLLGSLLSGGVAWLRDGPWHWFPRSWSPAVLFRGQLLSTWTWGLEWSPLLWGTGLLIGPRTGLSLVGGAVVAWGLGAPQLVAWAWASPQFESLSGWLMWPGVALLLGHALTSLILHAPALIRGMRDVATVVSGPSWALLVLGAALMLGVVSLGVLVFSVHPVLMLLAVGLSLLLSVMSARAAGETDILPSTQMGQLTQATAGVGAPGYVPTVVAAAAVTASATQSAQMLWALKTGQMLEARLKPQVVAQGLGAIVGALVVVPVFYALVSAYGLGTESLPAPTAQSWRALGEMLANGGQVLPPRAAFAMVLLGTCGVGLALLERTRWGRWAPSASALSIGFLIPAQMSLAIALGSLMGFLITTRHPSSRAVQSSVAGGMVLGEALMALALAVWILSVSP